MNNHGFEEADPVVIAWRTAWQWVVDPAHSNAITAIATAMIFVSGVIYGAFSVLQWRAGEKAANAAQSAADTAQKTLTESIDSFRIDERAWVEIEPIKPTFIPTGGKPNDGELFTCDIYPKNSGKTVASDVSVKATDVFTMEGFDKNRRMVNSTQDGLPKDMFVSSVPRVLAPNTIAPAPFRVTCQAPQIFGNSGHQAIHYIVGRIDYCDQFRVRHWMRFCQFVVNNHGEIWNCREGNDEDRNPETLPDPSCT